MIQIPISTSLLYDIKPHSRKKPGKVMQEKYGIKKKNMIHFFITQQVSKFEKKYSFHTHITCIVYYTSQNPLSKSKLQILKLFISK